MAYVDGTVKILVLKPGGASISPERKNEVVIFFSLRH